MPQAPHKVRKRIMSIEGRTERLYQALVTLGPGYHPRVEIAQQMGVQRLFKEDVSMLDQLIEAGRIEATFDPTPDDQLARWKYRVVDHDQQTKQ